MRIKSFLVLSLFLTGCEDPLSIPVCGIIKPAGGSWYFFCEMSDDKSKEFELPLDEPMVCTTVQGYKDAQLYIQRVNDKLKECKSQKN